MIPVFICVYIYIYTVYTVKRGGNGNPQEWINRNFVVRCARLPDRSWSDSNLTCLSFPGTREPGFPCLLGARRCCAASDRRLKGVVKCGKKPCYLGSIPPTEYTNVSVYSQRHFCLRLVCSERSMPLTWKPSMSTETQDIPQVETISLRFQK